MSVWTASAAPDTTRLPPLSLRALDAARPKVERVLRHRWRIETHGQENLPAGPVVFAVNHLGVFDGPLLVAVTPGTLAMAKIELYRGPVGRALTLFGQIPVDRSQADLAATRRCLQVLQSGRRLAIFPEAHRGPGDFRVFKPGVAYFALVTGAPVVPVALLGTRAPGHGVKAVPPKGSRICVVYGEPVDVPAIPWPRTPELVGETAARLQEACRRHVVAAQELTGMALPPWKDPS